MPTKTLTRITPATIVAGRPSFDVVLTGTHFVNTDQVLWNGVPLTGATCVSPTELKVTVPAAKISVTGIAKVKVVDSAGANGSAELDFTVTAPTPEPDPEPEPEEEKKPFPWWFWVIIAIAVIMFGVSLFQAGKKAGNVPAPTQAPIATEAPIVTEAPVVTEVPTEAPTAAPLPEAAVPSDFVTNGHPIIVNDQNIWPKTDPTNGAGKFVVEACQNPVAVYVDTTFGTYTEATTACLTGVMWFEPKVVVVQSTPTQPAPVVPVVAAPSTSSYEVVPGVTLGQCLDQPTRNARLDCATALYFSNGEKLPGIKAYFYSLGVEWSNIVVGNPFQPDAIVLPSGSPRIWGALVLGTNVRVTGNACLVTDVPSRIATFAWVYLDNSYAPRPAVGHYGEATLAGTLTEVAIHGDCSDWTEIRAAAEAAGFPLK